MIVDGQEKILYQLYQEKQKLENESEEKVAGKKMQIPQ